MRVSAICMMFASTGGAPLRPTSCIFFGGGEWNTGVWEMNVMEWKSKMSDGFPVAFVQTTVSVPLWYNICAFTTGLLPRTEHLHSETSGTSVLSLVCAVKSVRRMNKKQEDLINFKSKSIPRVLNWPHSGFLMHTNKFRPDMKTDPGRSSDKTREERRFCAGRAQENSGSISPSWCKTTDFK